MNHGYLNDVIILFAATVLVVGVFHRFRLPSILGYLVVGVVMGPYGLMLIKDVEITRDVAEFGVVFLLFTIGLEFSWPLLMRMKGAVLGLGGMQVLLGTVVIAIAGIYFGLDMDSALVLGGIVAMSSTALVIKQLTDQTELHTRHGRNAVGVLLFQDIMVIPLLIFVSSYSVESDTQFIYALLQAIVEGVIAVLGIMVIGRWALRPVFRKVAAFRSNELFTLTVLLVALGAAWATHLMGLSLALGAFIAGMLLAETEFRHQVEAEIRPFRDVLLALFFVTIGMLLNVREVHQVWLAALLIFVALVVGKLVIVLLLSRAMGWSIAVALRTGLILAHGGEFGFAVVALANGKGLFDPAMTQAILAALILSMITAPLLIRYNRWLSDLLLPMRLESEDTVREHIEHVASELNKHVIICGYGRVGQNTARMLTDEGIPYLALEIDPVLVQNAVRANEPVRYGDATNIELLKAAHIERARAVVVSLREVHLSIKVVEKIRHINTEIPIIVRVPDETEVEHLLKLGATDVIPETVEASLMLSSHLLVMLDVPVARVVSKIRRVRNEQYSSLRRLYPGETTINQVLGESGAQLYAVKLVAGSRAVGHAIAELGLEKQAVSVTAIHRGARRIIEPKPEERLVEGDILILFGSSDALAAAEAQVQRRRADDASPA